MKMSFLFCFQIRERDAFGRERVKQKNDSELLRASRAGNTKTLARLLLVANKADLNVAASEVTTLELRSFSYIYLGNRTEPPVQWLPHKADTPQHSRCFWPTMLMCMRLIK
jgi:hypothetical protein